MINPSQLNQIFELCTHTLPSLKPNITVQIQSKLKNNKIKQHINNETATL